MKKKIFLVLFMSFLVLAGCANEKNKEEKNTNEEKVTMNKVETDFSNEVESSENEKNQSENVEAQLKEKTSKDTKMTEQDIEDLLYDFGSAYADFSSIEDRNNKLKKLMTQECIDANGIDMDSLATLSSVGYVENIYKPMNKGKENEYAIYIESKVNGFDMRILLMVKLEGNKVSKMTYNTIKQEY